MLTEQVWCGPPSRFGQWCPEALQEHHKQLGCNLLLSSCPIRNLSSTVLVGLRTGELYQAIFWVSKKTPKQPVVLLQIAIKICRWFGLENVLQGNMPLLQDLDKRHDVVMCEINEHRSRIHVLPMSAVWWFCCAACSTTLREITSETIWSFCRRDYFGRVLLFIKPSHGI